MKKDIYLMLFIIVVGAVVLKVSNQSHDDAVLLEKLEKKNGFAESSKSSDNVGLKTSNYKSNQKQSSSYSKNTGESNLNALFEDNKSGGEEAVSLSYSSLYQDDADFLMDTTVDTKQPRVEDPKPSARSNDEEWMDEFRLWRAVLINSTHRSIGIQIESNGKPCRLTIRSNASSPIFVENMIELDVDRNENELIFSNGKNKVVLSMLINPRPLFLKTQNLISKCQSITSGVN